LQDPPKFTQIEIFGLTLCHLATLPESQKMLRSVKHFLNIFLALALAAAWPSGHLINLKDQGSNFASV
jgi:hypothetical protein